MSKPFLIGVGGQFANGKDTFCDYLAERLNRDFGEWHRAAMANQVKNVFCETFGVTREFVEEWKRRDEIPPGFDMPIRQALTFIGDGFRKIRNNIWIDLLLKDNADNLVIGDIRYRNECDYLLHHNGMTVLLWRPGHENDFANASEQELMPFVNMLRNEPDGIILDKMIPFDLWIKNDSDVTALYNKIDNIVVPFVRDFTSGHTEFHQ